MVMMMMVVVEGEGGMLAGRRRWGAECRSRDRIRAPLLGTNIDTVQWMDGAYCPSPLLPTLLPT